MYENSVLSSVWKVLLLQVRHKYFAQKPFPNVVLRLNNKTFYQKNLSLNHIAGFPSVIFF